MRSCLQFVLCLAVAAVLSSASGCAMHLWNADPAKSQLADQVEQPQATVYLEYQSASGKQSQTEVPLPANATVQDLIHQTKAHRKFRRIKVVLVRSANQEPFKMPVAYNNDKDQVLPANNYALHPGDRLLIKQDTDTVLDDMIKKLGL